MNVPNQSPPVERDYLRVLVGKQGKPSSGERAAGKKTKKQEAPADDYFVQLATFHIRPNWPR